MKAKHLIPFLVLASVTLFLSGADLFQRFMPRSLCMYHNQKLINLHAVSDTVIFIAYIGIGAILFLLYKALAGKDFPFLDLAWKFGGFIVFCGLTHIIGVLNLYVTYYWLDGVVKLVTAWFSILVFLNLLKEFKKIIHLKSPKEIGEVNVLYQSIIAEFKEKKRKREQFFEDVQSSPVHLPISVYVLDDDKDELLLLQPVLEAVCVPGAVRFFTDIQEFLAAIERGVHICVIDHQLGAGIDGIEVGKLVLQKNQYSRLILFSGSASAKVWQRAMNSGFCRGVDKNEAGAYEEVARIVSALIPEIRAKMAGWPAELTTVLSALNEKYKQYL